MSVTLKMNATVMIEFEGFYFIDTEQGILMCDEDGVFVCVIQESFFLPH